MQGSATSTCADPGPAPTSNWTLRIDGFDNIAFRSVAMRASGQVVATLGPDAVAGAL